MGVSVDVKFKVGDRVRRIQNSQLGHPYDNEGIIVKIFAKRLIIDGKKVKGIVWWKEFAELVEESSDLCNCDLDVIMAMGCQCKGN